MDITYFFYLVNDDYHLPFANRHLLVETPGNYDLGQKMCYVKQDD